MYAWWDAIEVRKVRNGMCAVWAPRFDHIVMLTCSS